jgi:HSP20 family protein
MSLIPRRFFLDNFDRFFDDFFPSDLFSTNYLKADIYEKDNKYFIEMEIPGMNKEDISIETNNGYLTVSASENKEDNEEGKNYIRRERYQSEYSRRFYIGDVEPEDIKAKFEKGILKIEIPKKEEEVQHKKKIKIE